MLGKKNKTLVVLDCTQRDNIYIYIYNRILSILTHTRREGRMFFKKIYSSVYSKGSNSWIYSTDFKYDYIFSSFSPRK